MRSELGERIFQEIGEDGVLEQLASALYYMSSTVQLMKCPRSRKEKLRPMLADEWADVLMSAGVLGIELNPDACGGKLISWAKAIGIEVGDEGIKGPPGALGIWPPFMLVGCAPDEVGPIGKPGPTEREMSDSDAQKVTNEVLKSLEMGGTMNTEITLLKWPGEEDWMFAKNCALVTIGKHSGKAPDMEWKHRMLRAKHSPIRTLNFAFYLHNVPYYVSTHLARHVHSVPFVKSQRNDRQSDYDRNAARQDAPVDMIWYMNAEELLTVASKRLCRKADPATQEIVKRMRTLVLDHCPEFRGLMAPPCAFMDECPEMEPCKEGQA